LPYKSPRLHARGEFLLDLIKPELVAMFAQAVELRGAHRSSAPSFELTAWYSAGSRTITSPKPPK
jgi:hypothetical protein